MFRQLAPRGGERGSSARPRALRPGHAAPSAQRPLSHLVSFCSKASRRRACLDMHPDDLAFLRFRLLRGARLFGPASARVTAVPLWALPVPLQVSSVVAAQYTVPPWALPVPLCSRS